MASSLGSWEDQHFFQWKECPTNADDVGAPLDLAVETLDWIGSRYKDLGADVRPGPLRT